MARADRREEECGEGSTHSSTKRGRREKRVARAKEEGEKRNPPARKVGER